MAKPVSSTQQYIPLSAVYDDVAVSKNGQFCQILMVNSVNFGLKSEEEQGAIISQYQGFLNSLTFPIQIVMHSKRLDLTGYLKDLNSRIAQEPNELIRYQTQEYVDFVQKLISIANIMDKKFFIIVPYQVPPTELPKEGLLTGLFGNPHAHLKVPLKRFEIIKDELGQRVNVVISGLSSLGITSDILNTKQLIELFYRTYNQEEALKEKLAGDIEPLGVEKSVSNNAPQIASNKPSEETPAQPQVQGQEQAQTNTVKVEVQGDGQNG